MPRDLDLSNFDKNFFYCVRKDGTEEVVVANDQGEIADAVLVISLEEVNRIREQLINKQQVFAMNIEQISGILQPHTIPEHSSHEN